MSERKNEPNICFVGGDKRQLFAAIELANKTNGNIFVSGEIFSAFSAQDSGNIIYEENPLKAIHLSRAVILPLPAVKAEKEVPFLDIASEAQKNGITVIGGMFSPYMLDILDEEKIKYADYFADECFTLQNAYITAEGAVKLAMDALDIMLRDARCAILGFGRIGMALGQMLLSLGCNPLVYARRREVRSLAHEMGCDTVDTLDIGDADVIFNTVPERIITDDMLLGLPAHRILIELASAPGGFDFEIAAQCSQTVIDGKGLPGKYAPRSAGRALATSISAILEKLAF